MIALKKLKVQIKNQEETYSFKNYQSSYAVTYDDTPLPHPGWSQTGWELDWVYSTG
jgi:hypothetical protein